MASEDNTTLKIRCPECQTNNFVVREDFSGRQDIDFMCGQCKKKITLPNPDKT